MPKKEEHLTNIPRNASFTKIALPRAKFCHRNPEKSAGKKFRKALALNPRTIVFYMDIIMNNLKSPPWRSHAPLLTPEEVLRKLFVSERKANAKDCNFVSVLCRAKDHRENLPPSTFRYPVEEPRELYNFDNKRNRLLRETFFHYSDLKLQGIFQDERRGAPNPTIENIVSWPNNSFL